MTIIKPETFVPDEINTVTYGTGISGTVEATIGKETKRVECNKNSDGSISAFGFVMKYRTGKKLWPTMLSYRIVEQTGKPHESVMSGRDERVGRCQMTNNIWFAPETK